MHYIVMDLEWNQPLFRGQQASRRAGGTLMVELIQIGAVKMDMQRRLVGSFNRYVAPTHYRKIHPRIRRITGIRQEDLADAPTFLQAVEDFRIWCGEDPQIITWGCDDASVLKHNMDFFRCAFDLPVIYDLQKLYAMQDVDGKPVQRSLQAALRHYRITPREDLSFHNAVDDAYYTALVMQQLPDITEATLQSCVAIPRAMGAPETPTQSQQESIAITSPAQYFASREGRIASCPTCGIRAEIPEGYVRQRNGDYMALADCPAHRLYFVVVSIREDAGKPVAIRSAELSNEQNPAYVKTKHLQWAQKVKLEQEVRP